MQPEQTEGVSDENLLESLRRGRAALQDLLHGYVNPTTDDFMGPPTRFLVLRDITLSSAEKIVTAVSDETPSGISLSFADDDGSASVIGWAVTRKTCDDLAALIRGQIGDPDTEMVMDHDGVHHMIDAAGENAVFTHKD